MGLGAILLWAVLAALTAAAGAIPPFQMAAMTFAIATLVGVVWALRVNGSLAPILAIRPAALALGVYGLLLFHICYFVALQRAPAVEASLIIYMWPLLIVLFSGLLPKSAGGSPVTVQHLAGALLGLFGTGLIVLTRDRTGATAGSLDGYVMAAAAAFIWASYSVASRLLKDVPTSSVTASCAATALGALMLHLMVEATVWPQSTTAWLAVLALGFGPVGLAFFLWDEGMKHGDIRLLGVASYATPLLSTLLLGLLGTSKITPGIWLAAGLISLGAFIAGRAGDTAE